MINIIRRRRSVLVAIAIAATAAAPALFAGPEPAAQGVAIKNLPESEGLYRIPYANGTDMRVSRDHNTHTPPGRYDLVGTGSQRAYRIVAAADGIVMAVEDDYSASQDSDTAPQCNNNYVWIAHANGEWTKYSHMLKDSSSRKAGLKNGDTVKAGQYLGDEGAVGCAAGDHLHFEVGVPRANDPIKPIGGFLRDNDGSKRNRIARICGVPGGVFAAGRTHEARDVPGAVSPGRKEVARHGLPIDDYQCLFDQARSAGYEPVWLDLFNVGPNTYVNAIFREAAPGAFQAFHGLSGEQYQKQFDKWTGQGYRPVLVESYLDDGVRYAVVFKKSNGPPFAAYHGLGADAHQKRFDDLTDKGYRPIAVSVVSRDGRRYTALYEKADVGGWQLKSQLTPGEYQDQYEKNSKAGRRIAYLNAYNHDGSPQIIAIWTSKTPAGGRARHGLDGSGYQAAWEDATKNGLLTRAVVGYEANGEARYAASWRK